MYIDPVRYEGRPGNVPERLEKEQRCYALLDELQQQITETVQR